MKPISPLMLRWFTRYAHWYVGRHFHALRLTPGSRTHAAVHSPIAIFLNHPSWWDPLVCLLLSQSLWPSRRHYAPIDAGALGQYPLLARMGFFPVERGPAGARRFLRNCRDIFQDPAAALWITPGGAFADVRARPVSLRAGIAHLPRCLASPIALLPLALEYPFWDQRLPEALCHLGEPIMADAALAADTLLQRCNQALEQSQETLAALALRRDPTEFETILTGRVGVGGVYDLWRSAKALLHARRFDASHITTPAQPAPAQPAPGKTP